MGNLDSALVAFERAITVRWADGQPWTERLVSEYEWLPIAYRRLGELYEQRGDSENALRYYNEFVELWKNADPVLQAQVEDVRQRIARLVGEPQGSVGHPVPDTYLGRAEMAPGVQTVKTRFPRRTR